MREGSAGVPTLQPRPIQPVSWPKRHFCRDSGMPPLGGMVGPIDRKALVAQTLFGAHLQLVGRRLSLAIASQQYLSQQTQA